MKSFDRRLKDRVGSNSFVREFVLQFEAYNDSLQKFLQQHDLAAAVSALQLDHLAFKCKDADHYRSVMTSLLQDKRVLEIFEIAMPDKRRISAVIFGEAPLVGVLWDPAAHPGIENCRLLEIIEPRPERVGADVVGIDHIEVLVKSEDELRTWEARLKRLAIACEIESNPRHKWLSAPLRPRRSELEFTNVPFMHIVKDELAAGHAVRLR